MLAIMAQVEPFPLVPVTWMNFMSFWGSPISASSARMRSSPGMLLRQQTAWI